MGCVNSPSITWWLGGKHPARGLTGPGTREAEASPYIKHPEWANLVLFTKPLSPGAELSGGQLLSAQGVERGRRHLAWVGWSFKEVGPLEHSWLWR